jgi:flagellar motility protein MotE (MotC chaperone)
MMRFVRDFRLLPVVMIATGCLLALKIAGLITGQPYVLSSLDKESPPPAHSETSRAETIAAFRAVWTKQPSQNDADITGSVESKPAEKSEPAKQPATAKSEAKSDAGDASVALDRQAPSSTAERALLQRLQERRQEIEARAREIEIRENLLKSAEDRLQARSGELQATENQANAAAQKKEEADAARFKNVVAMYENMKAKDAAKIFDRLDIKILVDIAAQINPRRMSDIVAQMQPENAERLTVELAGRSSATADKSVPADLPKIEPRAGG